jgi:hypothetical protein
LVEERGARLAEKLGTKWYNEGEKSTRYFMRLLKRTMPDDFNEIVSDDGMVLKDSSGIEKEIVKFYKDLYEKESVIADDLTLNDFLKHVTPISGAEEDDVVRKLGKDEMRKTLHTCKDSAPGPDGIPYSIIGLLWEVYGPVLEEAWNYSLQTGNLPPSHKTSYLKLIPKAGKDPKRLTNWRPITLSNCDHKIITKAYTNRMSEKVTKVIKERQTAYLKGRLINDNLRSIIATIRITNQEEDCKGLLVALDAKKAFDSVDHKYIERCLISFGLSRFVPIFKTLYKNLNTDIIINGKVVKGFDILRGVKQGDSLSCIIFIMCIEPLLLNIEKNNQIEPIYSPRLNVTLPKTYAYADDVNPTIRDSINSLRELFKEYERLTNASGLMLNADKTEIMKLGKNVINNEQESEYLGNSYKIKTQDKVKINGIILQRDERDLTNDNVEACIKRMDDQFKKWSRRNLTVLGKILIAKTFGISQLIFLLQTLCIEDCHVKKINAILYKFIWNRRYLANKAPERVRREIVTTDVKKGGFGMLDISELDYGLKIRALGRLVVTKHPFLEIVKNRVSWDEFFNPKESMIVENVTIRGLDILTKDRDKMWEYGELASNAAFLDMVRKEKIINHLTRTGRNSSAFYITHRRGRRLVGDLDDRELNDISRYIDNRKLNIIRRAVALRNLPRNYEINYSIWLGRGFKELSACKSKELRLSLCSRNQLTDFKIGISLSILDSRTFFHRIAKLTSTQHKALLLRIVHGDIYTKEKLHKYGLSESNACPRCFQTETLQHKFATCDYVKRIWQVAAPLMGIDLTTNYLENILGATKSCCPNRLPLHTEILKRIYQMKDETNYLIHPKVFVSQAIKAQIRNEKTTEVKDDLKIMLDRLSS